MKDYILKYKPALAVNNDRGWAFDLRHPFRLERDSSLAGAGEDVRRTGEGRRGETIQCGEARGEGSKPVNQKTAVNKNFQHEFLHQASRLIPAELAETKTAFDGNLLEQSKLAA